MIIIVALGGIALGMLIAITVTELTSIVIPKDVFCVTVECGCGIVRETKEWE